MNKKEISFASYVLIYLVVLTLMILAFTGKIMNINFTNTETKVFFSLGAYLIIMLLAVIFVRLMKEMKR